MMNTFGHSVWVFALVVVFFAQAYAQLADTMLCADESCTEAISEGEARLAYRPRDDNFLNLKKGDVVLVKSKNAGKKTHLWGGEVMGSNRFGFFPSAFIKELMVLVKKPNYSVSVQEFLRKRRSPIPEDPYNDLVSPDKVVTDNEKQDVEKVESQQGSAQDVSTEEGRSPKEREESKKESHSDDSKVNSNEVQESDSDGGLPGKEENDSSMAQKVSIDDHKDSLAESGGHQVVQSSDKSIEDSMPADIAALLSSKNEGSESHKNIDTQQTVSQKTESNVQAEGHQYHSSEGESHEKKNKEEKDEAISEKKVDEANNEHADSATKEDDQYPTSQKESPEMKNNKEKDGVVSTESTHKSGVVSDESERDTDHHAQETEKNDGVEPDSVDDEKATTEHPNLVETDKTEDERKTENGEMMKAHNRTKHSNPITENVAKNDDVLSHKTAQETSHSVGDTADNNDGQDAKETHGDPDKTNQEMKKVDKEDIDEQIDEKSHKNEKGGDNKEKEPQKPAVKVDEEEDVDEQEEEKSHENEQKGGDNQEKEPQNPAEKVDEEEDIDEQEDGKYHKNEKETGDNREKEPQQPAVKVDEEEDVDEQEEKKSHENEQKAGDNQEKEPQKPAEQVDEEEDVHEQEEEKSHKKHKEAGDNQEKEPQKPAEQVDEEEDINEQEEEKSHKNEKEAGDNQEKEPEEPSVKMDEEQDVNEHEEENSYKNEEGRDSQEEDAKPENPVEKVNEKEGSDGPEKKEPRRNEEEGVDGREEEESQKSEPAGADGVEQEFKESEGLHADETPDDEENSVAGEVTESTLEDAAQKEQHMREDVTAESHDVKEKAQTENSGNADEMVGKKQETTEEKVVSQEKESTGESSTPEQAPADARKPDLEENVKKEGEVRSDPDGSEKSLEDKQLTVTEKSDDDTNAENVPNMSRKTDEGEEHNKSTKEREEENQVEMPQHEGQESLEGTDSQQTNARNITDHTAADEDGNEGVPSPDDVPEQHDEVHSKDATATTDETVLAEESIKKKASTQDAPGLHDGGGMTNFLDGDPLLQFFNARLDGIPLTSAVMVQTSDMPVREEADTGEFVVMQAQSEEGTQDSDIMDSLDSAKQMKARKRYKLSRLQFDPLLRWFTRRPQPFPLTDKPSDGAAQTDDESVTTDSTGSLELYQDDENIYTNLLDDPLLRWFIPNTCDGIGPVGSDDPSSAGEGSEGSTQDKDSKDTLPDHAEKTHGYTDLLQNPLLKWFIRPFCRALKPIELVLEEDTDSPPSDIIEENSIQAENDHIVPESYCEDLLEDPLLRWFHPLSRRGTTDVADIEQVWVATPEGTSHVTHETTAKPYTSSYMDDPLLKWILLQSLKCPGQKMEQFESSLDASAQQMSGDTYSSTADMQWSCGTSSYLDHPLLKWVILSKSRGKCDISSTDEEDQIKDENNEDMLVMQDSKNEEAEHMEGDNDENLDVLKSDDATHDVEESLHEGNVAGIQEEDEQTEIEGRVTDSDDDDHELNGDEVLEEKDNGGIKKDDVEDSLNEGNVAGIQEEKDEPTKIEGGGTDYDDDDHERNGDEVPEENDNYGTETDESTSDGAELVENAGDSYGEEEYQDGNEQNEDGIVDASENEMFLETTDDDDSIPQTSADIGYVGTNHEPASLDTSSVTSDATENPVILSDTETNVWLALKNLINLFRESYEEVTSFRVGLTEVIHDMRLLKRRRPDLIPGFTKKGKALRQRTTDLEDSVLDHIQSLTQKLYDTGMSNENKLDIEKTFIPEYRNLLEKVRDDVQFLRTDINVLHEDIHDEAHSKPEEAEEVPQVEEKEIDTAKGEIILLQEKLSKLDEKLSQKDSESGVMVARMTEEAELFKSRIKHLEELIVKRDNDEKIHSEHSKEKEKQLTEKLEALESALSKKREEETRSSAEVTELNRRLEEMESSIKMSVDADKPFLDRIAALEGELEQRKKNEADITKQEQHDATRMQLKLQALERQLRKQQLLGNTKLLDEARELQRKVKSLESDLASRSEAEKIHSSRDDSASEVKNRLAFLEEEFSKQQETRKESAIEKADDLELRILEMEKKLKDQIDAAISMKTDVESDTVKNVTVAKTKSHNKRKRRSKMSKKQIVDIFSSLFLHPDKIKKKDVSSAQLYRNQTEDVDSDFSETSAENNSDFAFNCIVEPSKRKACGARHFSKKFCNALQCCWSPVADEPSIPPCYFSLLQMDNAGAASNADEQLKDGDPDSYHALHEGKIVNWDEALDVDLEKKKTPGWDEVLGGGDEASQTEKEVTHESKISEGGESGHQDVTGETPHPEESVKSEGHHKEPGIEHEEDVATTPSPHQTLTPESSEHISNEMDKQDVTSQTSTTVTEVQKDPDTDQMPGAKPLPVPEMKDTVDKDAIEPSHTSTQDFVERPTAAIDKVEDAGTDNHTDGRDFHHGSEEEKSGQEFDTESELHVESIWLRLLIVLYNFPFDILYILEPFFLVWISLLPEEYQKDVYGVPWSIVLSTFFVGFFIIWLFICRSRSSKRRFKDEQSVKMIQELRTQLDNIIQDKLEKENELKTKQIELDLQRDEITNVNQEKFDVVTERTALQHSLREYSIQNDSFKRDIQLLNQQLQEKDNEMHEVLTNSDQVRKSLSAQQETISQYKDKLERLQSTITENESSKRRMEDSIEKYKERIKSLEIAKGETKKEGKTLKDQTEKLGQRIAELEKSLNAEKEEAELKRQEVDVLKDCILQFKGVQEYLSDEGEDAESEESIEKQKEKMRSMVDVSVVRNQLRQAEAEKLQITYELEAERKEKFQTDGKVSELEATIQSDQAVKNKLEKDKQTLESKLTVMQEFYAKREVEIQSKLGMEQSRRESNATLLEDQQKQQLGLINQLDAYKKMSEDAKKQYEETERQHKQEILGFEKKSHENWLASRDAERKLDEANKQINQLHLELTDLQRRLRDREDREPILRPRPERHGPPGAPPPFGPPRRGPPPPGVPGSPLHFRNGPPSDVDRRSPPPMRRAPSPGNSINEEKLGRPDRPPSRPDRPPSAHSLPPMDRRPPSGPPMGHGPYPGPPPGRFGPYRGPPGARPPPPGGFGPRPMPGQRLGGAPMTSSPYMEQSPIPPTRSPGPHSQNFTQSSLHAPPPQMSGDSLRNEGLQPSPIGLNPAEPPPHATPSGRSSGGGNPFRRAR